MQLQSMIQHVKDDVERRIDAVQYSSDLDAVLETLWLLNKQDILTPSQIEMNVHAFVKLGCKHAAAAEPSSVIDTLRNQKLQYAMHQSASQAMPNILSTTHQSLLHRHQMIRKLAAV